MLFLLIIFFPYLQINVDSKNKKDNLIEKIQEEIVPEKKKRIASQKTLDALALGRKKRQDALLLKRQEHEKQMELNKKVRKVNKIFKQYFSEDEISEKALKPVLKKKEPEVTEMVFWHCFLCCLLLHLKFCSVFFY